MAKRLTDTEIWNKRWFRELPAEYKLFWSYLKDNCNLAGVWDVDLENASFKIGMPVDGPTALKMFGPRVYVLDATHWLLSGFVRFQNKLPLGSSPVHQKIEAMLDKYGLYIKDGTLYNRVGDTLYHRVPHTPVVIYIEKESIDGSYSIQENFDQKGSENEKILVPEQKIEEPGMPESGPEEPNDAEIIKETLMINLPVVKQLTEQYEHLIGKDKLNALSLAKYMHLILISKYPTYQTLQKAKVKVWMRDADLLLRVDKVEPRFATTVFKFAMQDTFWSSIVRSPENLRKNFEKIRAAMERGVEPKVDKKEPAPVKKEDWTHIGSK